MTERDAETPRFTLPRGALRVGLALGMLQLVRVQDLVNIGWEAWGGVAVLALVGASSVKWRTRPDALRAERTAALAALGGIALAAGGLARTASPIAAIALLSLALLSLPSGLNARWRVGSIVILVAMLAAGFVWVGWSTAVRVGQVGATFALGALVANVVTDEAGWIARAACALAGVAAAAELA